jgi:multimeric flavodoxin WrbA
MKHLTPYNLFEAESGVFKPLEKTIEFLKDKKSVFITTSNRWDDEIPKSTELAFVLSELIKSDIKIIDAFDLKIHTCEGNVSHRDGNHCGTESAIMKDADKNPDNFMRCWASLNNKDDELWKISKEIYYADCIVFFGSIRWGSMNSTYQKLLERLTWIENRQSTLKGENPVKGKSAGLIVLGHNWRGKEVLKQQKEILSMFGFETPKELFFNNQWTKDMYNESEDGYIQDAMDFDKNILDLTDRIIQ